MRDTKQTSFQYLSTYAREAVLGGLVRNLSTKSQLPEGFVRECAESGLSRYDVLHLAIIAKEMGNIELADACLSANIVENGPLPADLYELSIIRIVSDAYAGIDLLKQSISLSPEHEPVRLAVFVSLLLNDEDLLAFAIERSPAGLYDKIFVENGPLIKYLTSIGSPSIQEGLGLFDGYIQIDESIKWTSRIRSGGSLIRIGDGEGAMSTFGVREEAIMHDLYTQNRRYFARRWVGDESRVPEFTRSQTEILKGLSKFDVVGVPNPTWMIKCLTSGDATGFSCALNAIRAVKSLGLPSDFCFVRTSAFYDVLHRNMLGEIIATDENVVVVSWNDLLPMVIRQRGFSGNVRLLKVLPSTSDVAGVFATDPPIGKLRNELTDEQTRDLLSSGVTTVILAGGHLVKMSSIAWRELGFRILDAGSALDVQMGLPIR